MRQSALARPQPPVAGFRRIPLLRFVPFLVATGANVHARRRGGITPLHEAAGENTHAGVVTALVEAGVDPNAQDRDGVAPLYLAAGHGSPAVVTALVAAGADLNVRGPSGKTPLGVAWPDDMNASTFKYRVPVVRELLRLGADGFGGKDLSQITNPTYCGHWHTATFHRVAVPADLARCLEEGADVLARDRHGNTVLHGIASMDAPVAAVLLVAGAEVNARNSRGDHATPQCGGEPQPGHRVRLAGGWRGHQCGRLGWRYPVDAGQRPILLRTRGRDRTGPVFPEDQECSSPR